MRKFKVWKVAATLVMLLAGSLLSGRTVTFAQSTNEDFVSLVENAAETGQVGYVCDSMLYETKEDAMQLLETACKTIDAPLIFQENQCYISYSTLLSSSGYRLRARIHKYEKVNDLDVTQILGELNLEGTSDVEKALRVRDWLCEELSYGKSQESLTACLEKGVGKCDDYSMIYATVMNAAGVETRCMDGIPNGSLSGHMWNMVKINGKWYLCDVTNDDRDGNYEHFLRSLYSRSVRSYLGAYIDGYRLCNGVDQYLSYTLAKSDYFKYISEASGRVVNISETLGVSVSAAKKATVCIVQIGTFKRSVKNLYKVISYNEGGAFYGKIVVNGKARNYLIYSN
jgi:hypothetical protein